MEITKIKAEKLKKWLDGGEAILIDVREGAEYQAINISGAVNLPLSKINLREILALTDNNGKKIILHCQAGKRSDMACKKIMNENPEFDIYELDGGIDAWQNAGLPVNKTGSMLPLDRQVQCVAAFFIFLGLFLNVTVGAVGNIFIIITGLGLAISGIFGHCLMIPILAKMPWNMGKSSNNNCCSR